MYFISKPSLLCKGSTCGSYVQARVYDDKVRDFVKDIGIENIGKRLVNSREGAVSLEPILAHFWSHFKAKQHGQ